MGKEIKGMDQKLIIVKFAFQTMVNMIKCYTNKIYMLVECTFVNYGGAAVATSMGLLGMIQLKWQMSHVLSHLSRRTRRNE